MTVTFPIFSVSGTELGAVCDRPGYIRSDRTFYFTFDRTAIWVALAALPGQIAKKRNHPQAEAANVGGWLGALLGGVFWPIVLVWAFIKPQPGRGENNVDKVYSIDKEEFEVIKNKLTALEARANER